MPRHARYARSLSPASGRAGRAVDRRADALDQAAQESHVGRRQIGARVAGDAAEDVAASGGARERDADVGAEARGADGRQVAHAVVLARVVDDAVDRAVEQALADRLAQLRRRARDEVRQAPVADGPQHDFAAVADLAEQGDVHLQLPPGDGQDALDRALRLAPRAPFGHARARARRRPERRAAARALLTVDDVGPEPAV